MYRILLEHFIRIFSMNIDVLEEIPLSKNTQTQKTNLYIRGSSCLKYWLINNGSLQRSCRGYVVRLKLGFCTLTNHAEI